MSRRFERRQEAGGDFVVMAVQAPLDTEFASAVKVIA